MRLRRSPVELHRAENILTICCRFSQYEMPSHTSTRAVEFLCLEPFHVLYEKHVFPLNFPQLKSPRSSFEAPLYNARVIHRSGSSVMPCLEACSVHSPGQETKNMVPDKENSIWKLSRTDEDFSHSLKFFSRWTDSCMKLNSALVPHPLL